MSEPTTVPLTRDGKPDGRYKAGEPSKSNLLITVFRRYLVLDGERRLFPAGGNCGDYGAARNAARDWADELGYPVWLVREDHDGDTVLRTERTEIRPTPPPPPEPWPKPAATKRRRAARQSSGKGGPQT